VSHEQSTGHHGFSVFSTFRDVRRYVRDYSTYGTSFAKKCSSHLSPTLPVGLTPDQNQERPEAIHAGGSCSGIADADEVQCWFSRPSTATRLRHWMKPWKLRRPEREYDHRCKICRVFHLLSTCAAAVRCTQLRYSCKSSSPTAPSRAVSQAWLADLGCLAHTVATGSTAPHRIAILGSITRSALAILALGRSQK
jgi:hypothetical protein